MVCSSIMDDGENDDDPDAGDERSCRRLLLCEKKREKERMKSGSEARDDWMEREEKRLGYLPRSIQTAMITLLLSFIHEQNWKRSMSIGLLFNPPHHEDLCRRIEER